MAFSVSSNDIFSLQHLHKDRNCHQRYVGIHCCHHVFTFCPFVIFEPCIELSTSLVYELLPSHIIICFIPSISFHNVQAVKVSSTCLPTMRQIVFSLYRELPSCTSYEKLGFTLLSKSGIVLITIPDRVIHQPIALHHSMRLRFSRILE